MSNFPLQNGGNWKTHGMDSDCALAPTSIM